MFCYACLINWTLWCLPIWPNLAITMRGGDAHEILGERAKCRITDWICRSIFSRISPADLYFLKSILLQVWFIFSQIKSDSYFPKSIFPRHSFRKSDLYFLKSLKQSFHKSFWQYYHTSIIYIVFSNHLDNLFTSLFDNIFISLIYIFSNHLDNVFTSLFDNPFISLIYVFPNQFRHSFHKSF